MKKVFFCFMLSAICCISLAGCGKHGMDKKTNLKTQEKNIYSSEKESAVPFPLPTDVTKQDNIPVCFIGNSLIDYGNQANFLTDIAAGYGRKISVDKITWGGAYLSNYVTGTFIDKKTLKKRLKKTDIVVFQDYGGWQGTDTLKAIQKLIAWCKDDASFYYYMYDEDDAEMQVSDYKKLAKLRLKLIPKGQMIDTLFDMSYTYEELHLENDFHPNILNGYMAALVMNSTIFDEKCTELSKEYFFSKKEGRLATAYAQVLDGIHGDSKQEKWDEFQIICEKADKLVQDIEE